MQNVHIDLGARSYDIRIGDGILGCAEEILPWIEGKQAFVVTNSVVAPLYLETLKAANIVGHDAKKVKVINTGTLDRAVTIKGLGVTKGAKAAIEAAGGKVE